MADKTRQKQNTKTLRREDRLWVFRAALIVTLMVVLLSVGSLIAKDRDYSANENRYLAGRPALSLSSLTSGKFMEDTEAYLSDQFLGRDLLVRTRAGVDRFVGKREVNGVYVGKDHFLFEKPSTWDDARMTRTLNTINLVTAKSGDIRSYMAIAPNATELLKDYLPTGAPVTNQTQQISAIYKNLPHVQCVDLVTPLKAVKDPTTLYYRTDHHWTAAAAEVAFREIAVTMGLVPDAVSYRTMPVTNSFRGTMASSSGIFKASDTISITVPEKEQTLVVTYVNEDKKTSTLFDASKLKEKSQYDVFFGGNFAEVRIDTGADSDRVLLVLKDSYANCVIPMMTPFFKTIVLVDPRYYNDNLPDTIAKEGVTDLLWFYNVNTFLNDTSIGDKLG
ncbi:MAG: hypothetical protein IJF51_04275 [Clostridia bacterium]|nr:hypothetical protein [Clostridia bacterium]